jgi:hypothetical protein
MHLEYRCNSLKILNSSEQLSHNPDVPYLPEGVAAEMNVQNLN